MPVTKSHPKDPDPASTICRDCEHALSRHTVTAAGAGPNATDDLRCNVCGIASGTHHAGYREGLTEPRQSTVARP